MRGSTSFGCFLAHHQELTTVLTASGFNVGQQRLERCWSWSGRLPARPRPTTLLPPRSNGKTRGCQCSCKLLMMGEEAPETCWATHKRQVINLWNCCILLVNLFESYDDARTYKHQKLIWDVSEKSLIMRTGRDYNLLPLVKELHIQGIVEHFNLYIVFPKNEVEINAVYFQ